MKALKWLLATLIFIAAAFAGIKAYDRATDGFSLANIVYQLPYEVRRDLTALPVNKSKELEQILSQDFHYIGKGLQSYAFRSDDGRYVLKFFKYRHSYPERWPYYVSWIPKYDHYRHRRFWKLRGKLDELFSSVEFAYEHAREDCGLVAVNLSKDSGPDQSVRIFDKMGRTHTVPLKTTPFQLQRCAKMLCPTLLELCKGGDNTDAIILLRQLLDLFLEGYEKGYADFDPAIFRNTGVVEGNPIMIDVGIIGQLPPSGKSNAWQQQLMERTETFREWLAEELPTLAGVFDVMLNAVVMDSPYSLSTDAAPARSPRPALRPGLVQSTPNQDMSLLTSKIAEHLLDSPS